MSRQCETAQLVASDLHYGKATATYNPVVFRERLTKLSDKLISLRELMAGYQFDALVVHLLGDVVDGAAIYPTQTHHQAVSDVREQAKEVTGLLAGFLRKQAAVWGSVRVEAVPGNHGRSSKYNHEGTNFDLIAYDLLRNECGSQIPVHYDDGVDVFVRRVEVRGHRYLQYHGQGIRAYQSIPWYGIQQRFLKWHNSTFGPFDVALMGHFHSCGMMPFNLFKVYATGTMVTDDEWARQELGQENAPEWWLLGTSDSRPVTWAYNLGLA